MLRPHFLSMGLALINEHQQAHAVMSNCLTERRYPVIMLDVFAIVRTGYHMGVDTCLLNIFQCTQAQTPPSDSR